MFEAFQDNILFEQERGHPTHLQMLVFKGQNSNKPDVFTIALIHCGLSNPELKEMTSLLHVLQTHFQEVAIEVDILQYMEHKFGGIAHELLYNMPFLKERMKHVLHQLQMRFTNLILMPCGLLATAVVNILLKNDCFKVKGVISCLRSEKNAKEIFEKLVEWDANSFFKSTLLLWDCSFEMSTVSEISPNYLYYPFHSSFSKPITEKKHLQQKIIQWLEDIVSHV